ncbi:MAG: AI-2E family transporter [bacterium]
MNNKTPQSIHLEKILTFAIVIIMVITIGFALYYLKAILMPFIVAILLSYIFYPGIQKLYKKFKIPRAVSIIILCVIIFFLTMLLGTFLFKNINEFIGAWPAYQKELEASFVNFYSQLHLSQQDIFLVADNIFKNISFSSSVSVAITSSVVFLTNVFITLLFMVFLLFSAHTFPDRISRAFSKERADKIKNIIKNINEQVEKYLLIKTFISLFTGLSVYLILSLINIKFAFLWGVVAFFLNYIPNVGSFVAGIPPILTAFLQFDLTKALVVLLVFAGIQFFWGNIVEPLVIGKRLNLSPIVILFALLFWFQLWGVVGAIIAVPLTAIIKIVFSNIEGLKPIAILVSDK